MKSILVLLSFSLTFNCAFSQDTEAVELDSTAAEIHWISFEEAYELHQTTPKKWVIDVSTAWCGWCKRMDKTTFSDSLVIDHVNSNYYAVALDGEEKNDIVVGDKTYQFVAEGRRGYNQLPAELMGGKMSYPTIVFLGEGLENLSAVPGYKNASDFHRIISFFSAYDATNNPIKWEDFAATYVSPYPAPEEVVAPVQH